jgi:LysR family glycine cleavage system transcriptional activator
VADTIGAKRSDRLLIFGLFRTFDAAARHQSFRNAADELCVTPSAVSQQIHRLEDLLRVKLFHRLPRRIELTSHGASLATSVQEALALLNAACDRLTHDASQPTICVDVAPGLGSAWLLPRLSDFRAQHPDVTVLLQSSNDDIDFARQGVDIAIRWGTGRWPGARAVRLAGATAFPVCSPEYRDQHGLYALSDVPKLRDATLLQVTVQGSNWTNWFAKAGHAGITFRNTLQFSNGILMLGAATYSQGICLSNFLLVENDLRTQRLVCPFDVELDLSEGYYVLTGRQAEPRPAIDAFRDWIRDQAKQSMAQRGAGGGQTADRLPPRPAQPRG